MKEAKFRYKCRLCGQFDDNPCTSVSNAILHLHNILYGEKILKTQIGIPPTMTKYHICEDGKYGIMDLLGFIVVDIL